MAKRHEPLCILDDDCPLRLMFDLVGDRWSSSVLFVIGQDTKRYSDLQKQIPTVSKKMLTQTLRKLERAGLVKRVVYAVVPPKTEYTLTKLGLSILKPIQQLADWGVEHEADLRRMNRG